MRICDLINGLGDNWNTSGRDSKSESDHAQFTIHQSMALPFQAKLLRLGDIPSGNQRRDNWEMIGNLIPR